MIWSCQFDDGWSRRSNHHQLEWQHLCATIHKIRRPVVVSVARQESTAVHGEQLGKGHRLSSQCLLAPSQLLLWKVLQLLGGIHSHNKGGFQKQYGRVERIREKPKATSYTDSYSQLVVCSTAQKSQAPTGYTECKHTTALLPLLCHWFKNRGKKKNIGNNFIRAFSTFQDFCTIKSSAVQQMSLRHKRYLGALKRLKARFQPEFKQLRYLLDLGPNPLCFTSLAAEIKTLPDLLRWYLVLLHCKECIKDHTNEHHQKL